LLQGRDKEVSRVVSELDAELDFLGVTGVEDKLQENV
jgi:magnesium-transporting ATPase (P-type)